MIYPTMKEVDEAGREQLCRWHRFLPGPGLGSILKPNFQDILEAQVLILNYIETRLMKAGGFTPEISKKIGWVEI